MRRRHRQRWMPLLVLAGAVASALGGFFLDEVSIRAVLLAVLGIACAVVLALPFDKALQVFFIYLGIEGFAKIVSRYNPVVHVGSDILVVVLTARYLLGVLSNGNPRGKELPPFSVLLGLHFAWFLIAAANPYAISLMASLAAAKMYVTMPLLYFFGYYLANDLRSIHGFIVPWLIVGALQAATSLYQAALGPTSVTRISPGYAVALEKYRGFAFRPFGMTALPGGPSIYLFMIFPFMFHFFLKSRSLLAKGWMTALMGAGALVLILCQVRSATLKAIVGLGGFLFYTLVMIKDLDPAVRKRLTGFATMVSLLVALAIPKVLSSLSEGNTDTAKAVERTMTLFDIDRVSGSRRGALDRFLQYAEEAPLGAGLSRTGAAAGKFMDQVKANPFFKRGFFTDNFWVATVVDLGLPGTFIITCIVFGILILGAVSAKGIQDPGLKAVHGAILCALSGIVLGFYGAESILYNPEAGFFWFFAGVMMRIPTLDPQAALSETEIRSLNESDGEPQRLQLHRA